MFGHVESGDIWRFFIVFSKGTVVELLWNLLEQTLEVTLVRRFSTRAPRDESGESSTRRGPRGPRGPRD